jgi:hypothetical protein
MTRVYPGSECAGFGYPRKEKPHHFEIEEDTVHKTVKGAIVGVMPPVTQEADVAIHNTKPSLSGNTPMVFLVLMHQISKIPLSWKIV